jgi:integral membrane protein (TIGR01906 family)
MSAHRVHPLVAFVFAATVALAILLTGPMLLFAPPFVSFMQARHDVAARVGTDQATVDRATGAMLRDLLLDGDFTVSIRDSGEPVLDDSERSHMRDVGAVVRTLLLIDVVALVAVALAGRRLRREPDRRGRLILVAAAGIGLTALVLAAFFAFAFDAAFAAFHAVFFDPGTWQFGPDSNLLRFFPQPFWFELALMAGGTIVLGALLASALAWRDIARARRRAPAAG